MKSWIIIAIWAMAVGAAHAADIPAVLHWVQRVEVSPRVSGIVQAVNVQVGDRVKKGEALLTLERRIYRDRAAESAARVARYRAEAREAARHYQRIKNLYDRTVISTSVLDSATMRNDRARAMLNEAKARLALDRQNLWDAVLRAPFDALVVARYAQPGESVVVELRPQPVMVLARSGEMAARFLLGAHRMRRLTVGQAVTVVVDGRRYPGKIRMLGLEPIAEKKGPRYPAAAVFATAGTLRAGMPAVVKLP
ncbi:MAG TPA: hypothetical protein DEP05_04570 [Betaproteobacteria bacterium]|nr:hypothetical protein [Betaproteobacteria bacterium]